MAFHPQYSANGQFYVYFTDTTGDIAVDRYKVSATDPNRADPASASKVIRIGHRDFDNHNGGQLAFGPDGYLYMGTGDGGDGDDPFNNGQNFLSLLGKILRLDVSVAPYRVPPGNPFVGVTSRLEESWAYGVRNPWRFSFDAVSGKLYMGDVGQDAREEINVVDATAAGLNYGWRITEGTLCHIPVNCDKTGITMPAIEHIHPGSESITGGYVYRGSKIPELRGTYFYGDFILGWVKSFVYANGAATQQKDWSSLNLINLASFGVDSAGELYGISLCGDTNCNLPGTVYRLVRQ